MDRWVNVARQADIDANLGLSMADLSALCAPDGWLSDSLINYVVAKVGGVGGTPLGEMRNNVLFIKPTLVKLAQDGDDHAFLNSLGGADLLGPPAPLEEAPRLPQGAKILLLPVNKNNTHWSLLAFYEKGRGFLHFDSLRPSNDQAAQRLISRMKRLGYLNTELPFTVPAAIQRQNENDSHNCGLYVASFARMHLQHGGALTDNQIRAVDWQACDALRERALRSLQPLVARQLPNPRMPPMVKSAEVRLLEKQEMQEALEKVARRIEKDEAKPLQLSGIDPCPIAPPAEVSVEVTSTNEAMQAAGPMQVLFTVGKDRFVADASLEGQTWKASAKFAPKDKSSPIEITVTAEPRPDVEFQPNRNSTAELSIRSGRNPPVRLWVTPRPERRLFAKLCARDLHDQNDCPFPAGVAVEVILDEDQVVPATLQNDGTLRDGDKHAGIPVPREFSRLHFRFPASGRARRLQPVKDGPSVLKDPQESRVGYLLPKRTWEMNQYDWQLPPQHGGKRYLPFNPDDALGTEADPLLYVLRRSPAEKHMNEQPIDHVVVLMLENRGFDHFMGYLYEGKTQPQNCFPASPKGRHKDLRGFEGLEGLSAKVTENKYRYEYTCTPPDLPGGTPSRGHGREVRLMPQLFGKWPTRVIEDVLQPRRGARSSNVPRTNPHEDFVHILQDMYGPSVISEPYDMEDAEKRDAAIRPDGKAYLVPKMNGWPQNFCDGILHHHDDASMILTKERVSEILDMYLPDQLPVLSGLARNYAVSDLWFCSVPSQTNSNRAFWICGAATGLVTNDFYPVSDAWDKLKHFAADHLERGKDRNGIDFNRSLFDVLEERGVSWRYYWSMPWPPVGGDHNCCYLVNMCPKFADKKYDTNVQQIEKFFEALSRDKLETVTYLEPYWGGGGYWESSSPFARGVGNEFHPVQDVFNGELFVKRVYDALAKSKFWDKTLLVLTFDENGGTYDHFPPWEAKPPQREPEKTQFGFKFDCYGVRVPTLLISPHIKPQTLFRSPTEVPFDHTSIIATILKWLDVDPALWRLGDRVANAPTFDGVLDIPADPNDERRFKATGMGLFDEERKARRGQQGGALKFGDRFKLKYIGDKWAKNPPAGGYLGGPKWWGLWRYAVCSNKEFPALEFEFEGTKGQRVTAGAPLVLKISEGQNGAGRTLAVPEAMGAGTVYYYDGKNKSRWVLWPVNDRITGDDILPGDEVFLFSERYLPEKLIVALSKSRADQTSGGTYYDPYQRLSIDPPDPDDPEALRYARWRGGEWDIWRLELVKRAV